MKMKIIVIGIVLIVVHLLTELHSILYAIDPKAANSEVDLFLSPQFQFKLTVQWYFKMMFDDLLIVILCFLLANSYKNYSFVLHLIAIIYAFYHIIDLFLFFWNYKRTVAVYWFLGSASTIGVVLLFIKRLYPPKGGKVKSMI